MKIDNINDFERLERPRVQEIPGFYGKKLIDGVIKKLPMFSDESINSYWYAFFIL